MAKKNKYAIGSNGPVMYNGTMFQSQKQLNVGVCIGIIVAGFLPLAYDLAWLSWAMWIFGGLCLAACIAQKRKK